MTTDEYDLWLTHHKALFQMNTEADRQMFVAWWPLLKSCTPDELADASNYLAVREGKPLYRTEQLAEIRRRVTQKRQDRLQAEAEQSQRSAIPCELCHNSGFAVVPHPKFVIDGEWQAFGNDFPTVAVHCCCHKGMRLHETSLRYQADNDGKRKKDKVPVLICMTMAGYEMKNPLWREQVRQRESLRVQEVEASRAARHAHETHGQVDVKGIAARLAKKFTTKGR